MRRFWALAGLLIVGGISMAVARPQVTLDIQKVKDNLYVITGAGGNSAVFLTRQGVVLVDTKVPNTGPALLEKIRSVTEKPVVMVINTHTHFDHVGSNEAFTGAVEFVAHASTKANMERMPAFQSEAGKRFLPTKTFGEKLSLLSGSERIDLYHFGPGHTNGDSFVVFPALKVMHTGDLFPAKQTPIMDTTNGGSGVEYPRTLAKAAAGIRGVETVIPGHSAVTDWQNFLEFGEFMREFVAAAQQAKRDGRTVDEAVAGFRLPEKFKGYGMGRLKANVNTVYAETK